jgi:hypothetical protein
MKRTAVMRQALATVLALCLLVSQAWATSLQYTLPGTPVVFGDSFQTPNATWTLSALASGTGRLSARFDKGTGAQPSLYEMRCRASLTGTLTIGQWLSFYVVTSDGTDQDGALGTGDALVTVERFRNLTLVGVLVVDQTTQNLTMTASFRNVYLPNRYVSLAIWNATTIPLETSTSKHRCTLTPMPIQGQNS